MKLYLTYIKEIKEFMMIAIWQSENVQAFMKSAIVDLMFQSYLLRLEINSIVVILGENGI
jgi:hypothetical protein